MLLINWLPPAIPPKDNTTLKGKVMVGYQGWFRTPNDPEGSGWFHWGNIPEKSFSVDMWPDISQYPPGVLEKAADVKLKSGKQAWLFSSVWPEVADTHFRWMREHDIDGAFLQRFVGHINPIKRGKRLAKFACCDKSHALLSVSQQAGMPEF